MLIRSTSPAPADRARRLTRLHVLGTTWLTPHMIRVTAGGGNIADFPATGCTDQYVKMLLPKPGVRHPEPFDIGELRRILHRSDRPAQRTYTGRRHDPDADELDTDVVSHGDAGLAGPWAARARPGDEMLLLGLELPPGRVPAFVHGEAGWVRELRRHLLTDRQVPRDRLSISGYWRRGLNEEGCRAEKTRELSHLTDAARG